MSTISEHIEKLKLYSQQAYNNYEEDASKELKQAADLIEELSAKLEAANMGRSNQYYNGGWIPCSERLPEEDKLVLVSTKTGVVTSGWYTTRYGFEHREGFLCEDGFMWMNTANAWQLLPEPYKGE